MGTLWGSSTPRAGRGGGCGPRRCGTAGRQVHQVGRAGRLARGAGAAHGLRPGPALAEEGVSRPEDVVGALLDLVSSRRRPPRGAGEARGLRGRRESRRPGPGPPRARGRPRHPDHGGISTGVNITHFSIDGGLRHVQPSSVSDPHFAGSSLVALNAMVPQFVSRTAQAAAPGKDNILVVLEMTGGNDGLNTVIPYADDLYHKARPTLRQTKDVVIRLDDHVGLELRHAGLPADVGTGAAGGRSGRRLSQSRALALRSHGHLAVGRSQEEGQDRLAGPGRGRDRQRSGGVPILHIGANRLPLALAGRRAAGRSPSATRTRSASSWAAAPPSSRRPAAG